MLHNSVLLLCQGLRSSSAPCSAHSQMETAARPWIFPDSSSKAECAVGNMLGLLLNDPVKSRLPHSIALVWIECFYLMRNTRQLTHTQTLDFLF
ncbi:hypothetical protein PVL29_008570 [Vitis rotundifolia]|uniref:Uncharacterized protein n=1 Tax=Vitis rotundifolia TaxID=103349 RepID=A0AA39DT39_VITRO|nr:hypothetical protein PVL29_008570 [Vitis rotundifolia]